MQSYLKNIKNIMRLNWKTSKEPKIDLPYFVFECLLFGLKINSIFSFSKLKLQCKVKKFQPIKTYWCYTSVVSDFWTNEILAWAELCRVTEKIYKTTNKMFILELKALPFGNFLGIWSSDWSKHSDTMFRSCQIHDGKQDVLTGRCRKSF